MKTFTARAPAGIIQTIVTIHTLIFTYNHTGGTRIQLFWIIYEIGTDTLHFGTDTSPKVVQIRPQIQQQHEL